MKVFFGANMASTRAHTVFTGVCRGVAAVVGATRCQLAVETELRLKRVPVYPEGTFALRRRQGRRMLFSADDNYS